MCMRWRALYLQRSFASVALLSAKVDLGQAERMAPARCS
jgi:hypothetical protein